MKAGIGESAWPSRSVTCTGELGYAPSSSIRLQSTGRRLAGFRTQVSNATRTPRQTFAVTVTEAAAPRGLGGQDRPGYNTLQQSSRAALTTLLGGAEAANAQMDKLDEFARSSPFAKQVFIQAQQQLIGFGYSAKDVLPTLDAIQRLPVHRRCRSVGSRAVLRKLTPMSADELFLSLQPEPRGDRTAPDEPLAPVGESTETRARPTPHESKLRELLANDKLKEIDRPRVRAALARYGEWITQMSSIRATGDEKVQLLVKSLNEYKRYLEIELVWDSPEDFLFRQRGQLKVDNSVLEEFLPWLVDPDIIPSLKEIDCFAGPAKAFAAVFFNTTITAPQGSLGLQVRTKDQDFTLSRQAHIKASFDEAFPTDRTDHKSVWLAYLAAECKTNLDKTMFQEASATSHDLKVAMPGSKYYLVCEYLDMTPISSAGTDIDEVLILRGKRLASNKRARYSTAAGRRNHKQEYLEYLDANPIRVDVVLRFVEHLSALIDHHDPIEKDALLRGYF